MPTLALQNPLSQKLIICSVQGFIGGIYLIGTPVAVFAIALAGFLFVQARGNPTKLADAKKHLVWVLLGAALFLSSWLIAEALMNTVNLIIPGTFGGIASC